jgi:flagellar protein FlbD
MIELSRINGTKFVLNCDLIKFVESTSDTIITLSTNERVMVKESAQEVVRKTLDYRKRIAQEPPGAP